MILVIGAGVAGLSAALAAAADGTAVTLVTPGRLEISDGCDAEAVAVGGGNTALAQGGIAAAIGPGDSATEHAADTIAAGAGIVDAEAATQLTERGRSAVKRLLLGGFPADRGVSGEPLLGLEGAHRRPRIVHAGEDRSGAALHRHLVARLRPLVRSGAISVLSECSADSLITEYGAVTGAVLRGADGRCRRFAADAVVLATGGYAGLFRGSSNHAGARGEGVVLAARAGAVVADLEFVQFHPTVLHGTGLLVSEAVRGAGAVLRDESGRRFMPAVDRRAELASRDVVSRALHRIIGRQSGRPVWLDATGIEADGGTGTLARRFPRITEAAAAAGFDWAREPIPVSPAAHYAMGGVLSDLDGRTTVPGLFVAGEVASTGVHGANRLASNSLLEGLVFGEIAGRVAAEFAATAAGCRLWVPRGAGFRAVAARAGTTGLLPTGVISGGAAGAPGSDVEEAGLLDAFDSGLGIERDAAGIARAAAIAAGAVGPVAALLAMLCEAAANRTESRGSHARADFPEERAAHAERRGFAPRFPVDPPREAYPAHTTVRSSRSVPEC
ncbi:FAD-binding protein [Leucobacter sp. CSA2]|uniref:L-aspartate oxidase n=1 Tax=Leucobacter edaphi TaxID=2796472 RepID=A0A934QDI1_9MICO|nr:FAD-binding protein [Leucobacter edaphi]